MNYYLYVLYCENNSYYIGMTNDVGRRITEHMVGLGSWFTIKNKPIKIIELVDTKTSNPIIAAKLENKLTAEYILRFGITSVRGGSFITKTISKKMLRRLILRYL